MRFWTTPFAFSVIRFNNLSGLIVLHGLSLEKKKKNYDRYVINDTHTPRVHFHNNNR